MGTKTGHFTPTGNQTTILLLSSQQPSQYTNSAMVYNDHIKIDTFHVQHFSVWSNFNKHNKMYHISSENLCALLSINLKYMKDTKFQSAILYIRLQIGQLQLYSGGKKGISIHWDTIYNCWVPPYFITFNTLTYHCSSLLISHKTIRSDTLYFY